MCRATDAGRPTSRLWLCFQSGLLLAVLGPLAANLRSAEPPVPDERSTRTRLPPPDPKLFPGLIRLQPDCEAWIDRAKKRVVVQGGVCFRTGPIELFACNHQWIKDPETGEEIRRGTKEYESIVTINSPASVIHAALLAVGAESGSPVRFHPNYEPACGSIIRVTLVWTDADGQVRRAPAQAWIRNMRTNKPLDHHWVFAGSRVVEIPGSGERHYLAEDGNVICVSNFSDAMLDLPIKSTQLNSSLMFEAFTERIPPLGTPVTIVLEPEGEGGKSAKRTSE